MADSLMLTETYSRAVEKLGKAYRAQIKEFETRLLKNPNSPGLHLERIQGCKDQRMRSGRVNDDIRVILIIEPLTLLYVDHHDGAYEWARKRRIMENKSNGALTVYYADEPAPLASQHQSEREDLFRRFDDDYLVDVIGVPRELVPPLRNISDVESILELDGRVPDEILERVLDIACGRIPELGTGPQGEARDNRGTVAVTGGVALDETVQESLDIIAQEPRKQWIEFISGRQKRIARDSYERPVLLTGPAGTGKTVVLLHRAATLARLGHTVLLTTVGRTLAESVRSDLSLLTRGSPWESNICVSHLHELMGHLRDAATAAGFDVPLGEVIYDGPLVHSALRDAAKEVRGDNRRSQHWYRDEWRLVLEPQAVVSLEQYLGVERTGRERALQRIDREREWPVFERAVELLRNKGYAPSHYVLSALLEAYSCDDHALPRWQHVLVDEIQDVAPARLRLLMRLAEDPSCLFLAGDSSQRLHIPQVDVSALGLRLLRRRLTRSYRTTEAIRRFVEEDLGLRPPEDRSTGSRSGGPTPEVHRFLDEEAELSWIAEQCFEWSNQGLDLGDMGISLASKDAARRMEDELQKRGVPVCFVQNDRRRPGAVSVLHHHLAKGLEFDTMVVAQMTADYFSPGCWDWMPEDQRAEKLAFRRNLIYVALTRARERLIVTCGGEPPERLSGHRFVVHHQDATGSLRYRPPLEEDARDIDEIPFG